MRACRNVLCLVSIKFRQHAMNRIFRRSKSRKWKFRVNSAIACDLETRTAFEENIVFNLFHMDPIQ